MSLLRALIPTHKSRGKIRFGPLYARFATKNGVPRFTSWGGQVGKLAHNVTHRRTTYDTPGRGFLEWLWPKRQEPKQ